MRKLFLFMALIAFSSCGFKEVEPLHREGLKSWTNILTEARKRSDQVPVLVNLIRRIDKEMTLPIEEALAPTVSSRIKAHKKSESTLPLNLLAIRELTETQNLLYKNLDLLSEACTWNEDLAQHQEFVSLMSKLDQIETNLATEVLSYQKKRLRFNQLIKDPPLSWINRFHWKFTPLPDINLK